MFHMLRRQMIRPFRKPLIIISPKSLLRHKESISSLDDLANGEFQVVIPDPELRNTQKVKRVVFCSGKVYFDLVAARREARHRRYRHRAHRAALSLSA
jgi:2-oxoglutarate dehydrogenase E1 component